ncbi:SAF domain-containing protein [Ferviditalea candida]|uniref:SAF domain-containing protein n=1 Tax=Ferviditalea candida TaxID=3108399 RepID=A0ABU5ZIU9_9BACL|nr:SAF domain-containing protein [Paenibacillaceae bacterium T2]
MMNRRRNFMISLLSALAALLLVFGVYKLQLQQVELQKTVNVVVPKDFIHAGTMITSDLVEYRPVLTGAYRDEMVKEIGQVVGMETLLPLGAGEPVLRWKVDRFNLLPRGDQSTFQIPKSYILSVSNGIRAGDKVRLYISDGDGGSRRLFDELVTVASVKSAANVEVDDVRQSNLLSKANNDREKMYASRRDANGAIDSINLNLTEEQWLAIDSLCKSRESKLVIAFASFSITKKPGE